MCCWGGENRRAPNEKRKQAYHARFRPRGHTRKDREEHAETAGHLSGAGQIGPANTIGKPRWHQLSSLLHIHKMGESDRYERNRKEHPCKMDSVLARGECQWQSLSRPGQLSKQNPSPGQKHSKLAKAEPNSFHLRRHQQSGHLKQEPDDEIWEEDASRPCRRGS